MSTLRIGIAGMSGRMGRLLVEEVAAAGCTMAGGTARRGGGDLPLFADAAALFAGSDVVIDFTIASTAEAHAALAAEHGTPLVLGTSGLSAAQDAAVAVAARVVPVVASANFAPAATVLFALIEQFAAALPPERFDAEIVEMHHRQKVDAPSGTAVMMGAAVARGRGKTLAEVGMDSGRDGHTGPRATGPIGFAALRGGQVVGEHTLLFAGASEHVSLTHRSFDRRVYATGAVQAAQWVPGRPPGLYSMRDVMGVGDRMGA
jgi:4-hydroxy-tetrahydrodipicolinate reductase